MVQQLQGDVVIFALLLILKLRRWPTGWLFLFQMILYNVERFLLEMLRGDSPRFLFHWDAAQWTSAPVIVISLILLPILAHFERSRSLRANA